MRSGRSFSEVTTLHLNAAGDPQMSQFIRGVQNRSEHFSVSGISECVPFALFTSTSVEKPVLTFFLRNLRIVLCF